MSTFNPFQNPGNDIHELLRVTSSDIKNLRSTLVRLTSEEIDNAITASLLNKRDNTYIDIRRNMIYRLKDQHYAKISKNFKLEDIKFCESIGRNLQSLNIDILKIQEFQPQMRLFMMGLLISIIEQVLGLGQYNENALGGIIRTFIKGVMAIMVPTLITTGMYLNNDYAYDTALNNQQLSELVNPSRVQNMTELKMLFGSPIQQYAAYFSDGKWLNTYQIPFFNSKEFLYLPDCKNREKWTSSDPYKQLFGKTIGDFLKDGIKLAIPGPPKFKSEEIFDSSYPEISTSFYLINETEDDLIKNFKFLNSIFAGTQWFHMNYGQIRSPNVYNVTCPGKFNLIWAAMDLQVKGTGKLYPNMSQSVLHALAKTNGIDSTVINSMKWPAAWQVKVSIKSLVPYNFNTYMYYLLNGENVSKTKILATGQMMYEYAGDMIVDSVFRAFEKFQQNSNNNSNTAHTQYTPPPNKDQ